MNDLGQAIADWDGKSSDDIAAVYSRHHKESDFLTRLVELCRQKSLQKGGSWLIKHHLERGNALSKAQVRELLKGLPELDHWESRLHLLQSLPYLDFSETDKSALERFVKQSLEDPNKFVRAWAYNGFWELSQQFPEYRREAEQFLDMALRDEAPSVKARIRAILRQQS